MGHHEKNWINQYHGPDVIFYQRYVDDIFCLFNSEIDAIAFFHYLNSRHKNLKFTMEKEVENKLPFLDVLVSKDANGSTQTNVHRKNTFTGLLTNFFSFCSFSYKMSLVYTLIDRTYRINSNWLGFHRDLKALISILKRNMFPLYIIDKIISRYLTSIHSDTKQFNVKPDDMSNTRYFKLPYIGPYSKIISHKVKLLTKQFCNDLNIKLVFSSFKIRNMFPVKDPVPKGLCSNVVYKFQCAGCNACYIGETGRHFATRVTEHLTTDRNSHIFKHLKSSSHCQDLCSEDCFRILCSASTASQRKIKEALHIRWDTPSLNKQLLHVNLTLSF